MIYTIPETMQAAAIDRFGGIEVITVKTVPVPKIGADEVLIRGEASGVGVWDVDEREGKFAGMVGEPTFPYILGWDGAGTIVAVGEHVRHVAVGNRVYTATLPNHNGGGFYSQYAAVKADIVFPIPAKLPLAQAGVMG